MRTLILIIMVVIMQLKAEKRLFDDSYNLPNNVKPLRYILTMEPELNVNISEPKFTGSVIIELKALEMTKNITVHVRSLNITQHSIKILNTSGREVKLVSTATDEDREFYTIILANDLIEGEYYNLTFGQFTGDLKYDNIGFYLAKYTTQNGEERNLAITDFEPSDARKAFPCFDEPGIKATFLINLIRPENYTSLSNQELLSSTYLSNGRYLDTFKETVPMSTYLVAFVVCDFKHTQKKERHRIFARPQAIDSGKLNYALSESVEMLKALEEFTGVNFTLNKMDQIAIPDKHFADEAMENWGLVTYSEKHLFVSNKTSTTEDMQRCSTYIAHEFGHQWFGNLVTFKSWKYIWLSEGFGAYLQYKISSLVKPSWRLMDQFVLQTLQRVLSYDISLDVQPMNYQPKEILSIPSPWICYMKASSIIRMTEHFLTTEVFQKGLNIYLEKNKFRATEPSDLYKAFQEAVEEKGGNELLRNLTVSSILSTWDSNAGYPLVIAQRNYETGSIILSQERYFGKYGFEDPISIWYIPISYAFETDPNLNFFNSTADFWLIKRKNIIKHNFGKEGWFLINKQQAGYYRVNYDLTNWERLALYLNTENYKKIHPVNRAQLLHDSFHFAKIGKLPYTIPLNISKYLIREIDYIPITPFLDALKFINAMMQSSKEYDHFKNYIMNLLEDAYNNLGFDESPEDAHLNKLNRINVLKWMCRLGYPDSTYRALQKIRQWKTSGKLDVTKNLENEVLCCAMKNASMEDWDFLYSQYKSTINRRIDYYEALACSENVDILRNFLKIILKNGTMSTIEDRVAVTKMINTGNIGLSVVFKYLKNHPELTKSTQTSIAVKLGYRFNTRKKLNEMKALNELRNGYFKYGIKFINENLKWMQKGFIKDIENWVQFYSDDSRKMSNLI